MISMDGEDCLIKLDNTPTRFRSTVVRPYYPEETEEQDAEESPESGIDEGGNIDETPPHAGATPTPDIPTPEPPKRDRGRPPKCAFSLRPHARRRL